MLATQHVAGCSLKKGDAAPPAGWVGVVHGCVHYVCGVCLLSSQPDAWRYACLVWCAAVVAVRTGFPPSPVSGHASRAKPNRLFNVSFSGRFCNTPNPCSGTACHSKSASTDAGSHVRHELPSLQRHAAEASTPTTSASVKAPPNKQRQRHNDMVKTDARSLYEVPLPTPAPARGFFAELLCMLPHIC